ncbi:MAG: thiosulfate oxidation carrier protein SoxY, partial [Gammaproteobacteria bacterium]|nr:thiosulfate oxidation carrier protein SoxY [Gammaproteobacteria bacterium]
MAAWPKAAFEAKDVAGGLAGAMGSSEFAHSDAIKVKAPDIAENGSVVPVTISTTLDGVEQISIFADANGSPLVASFNLSGSQAYVSTRIKMGKTGNVLAVVKANGALHANKKEVKVTIGGCGG